MQEIPDHILQQYLRTGDTAVLTEYLSQRAFGDFIYQIEFNRQMELQEQEQEKRPGLLQRITGR